MSEQDEYYYSEENNEDLVCLRCNCALEIHPAVFSYQGNDFPVELPSCPSCGFVYVPEDLALGKILNVEKTLEDK